VIIDLNNLAQECPRPEIAAYIDGELTAADEIALDMHLTGCSLCTTVLNEQKLLLGGLDHGLRTDFALDLPKNFEKVVATRAASNVVGIRRSSEFLNTLLVCTGLLLLILVLISLGSGARGVVTTSLRIVEQIAAFGSFVGYIIYSLFLALTIILRSLASQFRLDLVLTTAFIFLSVTSLMLASRKWLRVRGA